MHRLNVRVKETETTVLTDIRLTFSIIRVPHGGVVLNRSGRTGSARGNINVGVVQSRTSAVSGFRRSGAEPGLARP